MPVIVPGREYDIGRMRQANEVLRAPVGGAMVGSDDDGGGQVTGSVEYQEFLRGERGIGWIVEVTADGVGFQPPGLKTVKTRYLQVGQFV